MADEQIVTNIVATSNFSSLITDVQRTTAALAKLQQQLAISNKNLALQAGQIQKSFGETLRSTDQFTSHFVTVSSGVEQFGKSLDAGKLKLRDYFKVYQDHNRSSGGLIRDLSKQQVTLQNALVQSLGKTSDGLMKFNVHVAKGLDETANKSALARKEMQIYNKVIQDGGNQIINWGKNTQWAGRQLTVGLTIPLVAFGNAAAKAFQQADQELVRLTKVYGGLTATSSVELAKVRSDVSATAASLAKAYGASYKDTIALAADIAATGKTGNELIKSTTETTRLAILGEVDRQDAMKATLAIQNAFKQNTTQLTESINFLNAVENQTSTSLADLIEAIPKAGPVIEGMGGSIKDLALYLTAMKEGGVNASEGANALKSALASLINPTKVAKEMMAGFGIDLSGIVTKNAGNLTETILQLQSALDTLNPLQKQQALEQLFGKFQFARMNALFANLGRQGSQTLQVLDLMKASSQDLANVAGRELAQVTESASGKYRRALEGLKADLAGVGEQFLKIGTFFVNMVDGIVKFTNTLPGPIKSLLTLVAGLTAVAGPLIMLTGVFANFFGYIIKGIGHFRALFKGAGGFKLLTPEILAASQAGSLVEKTFYSDAKAAEILGVALKNLIAEFTILETKAAAGAISIAPALSTMQGNLIAAGANRVANPAHPLIGPMGSRASAHMNPVSLMTDEQKAAQTIFGMVPAPGPVNLKLGSNPQMYVEKDLPKISGVTSIKGVSTGVVAEEAAKWHAMTGSLAMQSQAEIKLLKAEVAATGTITSELSASYQALLPQMTELTQLAASESSVIVGQLQAGKITVDQARTKIMTLNAEIEVMMGEAATAVATAQGRIINLQQVPLLNQPVTSPAGKSNMKELFHKGNTADLINKIARNLGVKTSGGGFSTETTIRKRLAAGGQVYRGSNPSGVDTVPAMLTEGEFVINKKATERNLPLLTAINNGVGVASPGMNHSLGGEIVKGFSKLASRGIAKLRNKSYARFFYDTKTGANLTKQAEALLESHHLGVTPKKPNGVKFTLEELEAIAKNPNKYKEDIKAVWSNIDKSHAAASRGIPGSNDYIAPGVLLAHNRSGPGGNRTINNQSEVNPSDIAASLESTNLHPMVILSLGKKELGYGNDRATLQQAYGELISGLNNRTKPFSGTDNFESFAEGILRAKLSSIENKEAGTHFWKEIMSMGTLRGVTSIGGKDVKKSLGAVENIEYPPTSRIEQITSRWPKKQQFFPMGRQYMLGNQDPLHGPLQIGRSMQPGSSNPYDGRSVSYNDQFGRLNIMDAFLTGTQKDRGMYATSQYMSGNLGIMGQMEALGNHPLGPVAAMKSLQKKFSGKLYRGVQLGQTKNAVPDNIAKAILDARESGNIEELLGKEFIMRRSSWSKDPFIASFFAPGSNVNKEAIVFEAAVRNRNILPASELFPNKKFQAPYGQSWNTSKFGGGDRSEQEAIFGGKFKIVGMDKGKVQLETVFEERAKGGPVNSGQPYIVGEKGPELFVPNNNGGIVPHYAVGGLVKGMAGILGPVAAQMILPSLGSKIGSKVGGEQGAGIGSAVGSGLGMASWMIPMIMQMKAAKKPIEEVGDVLGKTAGKTGVLSRSMSLLGNAVKFMGPWGIAAVATVTALGFGFKKYNDVVTETARVNRLAFAGAVKPAEDFDKKIKEVRSSLTAASAARDLLIAQNTGAGIPAAALSVQQFKELQAQVKKTYPDLVKLFNQTPSNKLTEVAAGLKAQFIGAGESADKASAKVYALLSVSDKAYAASEVFKSTDVSKIQNLSTSVQAMLGFINKAQARGGAKDFADSLGTLFTTMDSSVSEISKAKGTLTAIDTQFKSIGNSSSKNLKLTQEQIDELGKTSPILASMLSTSDSIGDAYAKWRIVLAGVSKDLSGLTSGQLQDVAKYVSGVSDYYYALSDVKTKEAQSGVLGPLAKKIDAFNKSQSNSSKLQLLSAAATQKAIKDAISIKEKQIAQIKKEADARKKALSDQLDQENTLIAIKKKQIEYQDALANGDMSAAAQAQLDIKQLVSVKQTSMASEAIDKNAQAKIDKLQAEIDKLNAKADKASTATSGTTDSTTKKSPLQDIYDSLNNLLREIELNRPGKQTTQDTQTFTALMKKLRAIDPAAAREINPSGTGITGITRPGSAVSGGAYNDLNKLVAKSDSLVASKIDMSNKLLGEIKVLLGGAPDVGTGMGTKASPLALAKVNSAKVPDYKGKTDLTAGMVDKKGILTNEGKHYLIEKNKLNKGDYFIYGGQKYVVETGHDAGYISMKGWAVRAAQGGSIYGPGTGTSDSIPAMLSNGEYVINAASVRAIGTPMLDRINKMASGGLATRYDIPMSSSMPRTNYAGGGLANSSNSLYNINVTLNGSNVDANDVATAIATQMKLRDAMNGRGRNN